MENKFYKVGMSGGTFVTALFFNPVTGETETKVARDYDYSDGSRDNDEIYYMPIDEKAAAAYRIHCNKNGGGFIVPGDVVKVYKGRKIPVGTVARVVKVYDYCDCYRRPVATYAVFEDGRKTSIYNCHIVEAYVPEIDGRICGGAW